MILSRLFEFKFNRNDLEIDSTMEVDVFNDKELIRAYERDEIVAKIVGDSVFCKSILVDTLFELSEK